jgi:hypothetical protein
MEDRLNIDDGVVGADGVSIPGESVNDVLTMGRCNNPDLNPDAIGCPLKDWLVI